PAFGVYRVGDRAPAGDLLGGADAGRAAVTLAVGHGVDTFTDHQTGVGALAVVLDIERGGLVVGARAGSVRRGHDNRGAHGHGAGTDRIKQAGHLRLQSAISAHECAARACRDAGFREIYPAVRAPQLRLRPRAAWPRIPSSWGTGRGTRRGRARGRANAF